MQTFLPYPSYSASAGCLDNKRLNKQLVEAFQIYTGRVPQKNHPACLMWENHKPSLLLYIYACADEYTRRTGKRHSCSIDLPEVVGATFPNWYGARLMHFSHKVNLVRKDPDHYAELLDKLPCPDLTNYPEGYYWPVPPVGNKAKRDVANWIEWAQKSGRKRWLCES